LQVTGARVRSVATVIDEVGCAPPVIGDATLLLQVFVNALLNAADACALSADRKREGNRSLLIRVEGVASSVTPYSSQGVSMLAGFLESARERVLKQDDGRAGCSRADGVAP
jgi:hypothetical protein